MKETKEFKSKLLISTIQMLLPHLDKNYYLNIIVNDDKSFKTNKMDFKNNSSVHVNQIFELQGVNSINTIKFQIFEKKNIFSNSIFKGEVLKSNQTKDNYTNNYTCFLSNNNLEKCAVVYYNYEIDSNLLEAFDSNMKQLEEQKVNINEKKSIFENLRDLSAGENRENFAKFVHNIEYLRSIETSIVDFIYWKNTWKTLGILTIYTMIILHWKIGITLFPLALIYFHVYNKDRILKFSHKDTIHDNLENITIITKIIEFSNKVVDIYENLLEAINESDRKVYEEIYANLLKIILWNILLINLLFLIIKQLFIISVWGIILWKNPHFQSFFIFIFNFINKKFIEKNFLWIQSLSGSLFIVRIKKFCYAIIPFFAIIRKFNKIKKEIEIVASNNSKRLNKKVEPGLKYMIENSVLNNYPINSEGTPKIKKIIFSNEFSNYENVSTEFNDIKASQELFKYELHENERWWMFLGWAKNLIMNERPLWSDISGKFYMDKNSVFLPNNEEYSWVGDWRIEMNEISDAQGWEYATDFKSEFGSKSTGKIVRRRKWIRYAKKIEI
jgi:hypothetical protein